MNKMLIVAAVLVVIGSLIFTCVMTVYNWDFTKLSTVQYETDTYEFQEIPKGIEMYTDTADIVFAVSEDGNCKVETREQKSVQYTAAVKNGILTVEVTDNRSFWEHIGINFGSAKVTVYLPAKEYDGLLIKESTGDIEVPSAFSFKTADVTFSTGDVNFSASVSEKLRIKGNTGDICVENASVGALDLSVTTGDVRVADVACTALTSDGNTGDLLLKNVVAAETFRIERSTGDVKFDRCDAAAIWVKTSTGRISGSLLSGKAFIAETSAGKVKVPQTTGGTCELRTSTGDILIEVA